jgi:methylmalonyl-CoA mutase cobalamin-binding subunit
MKGEMKMETRADDLLPIELPNGMDLVAEGRKLGDSVTVGRSLLCEEYGVQSEPEYKQKMVDEGRLMTAMDIGMQTWDETAKALHQIWDECERRGIRIDRYMLILDRRMGMPRDMWESTPKETGPMLETPEDWWATTHTVPIQPHLGDYMIGSPMSVENARSALEAGVSYIGNVSQFAWKYPGWADDTAQMVEMIKALGLMASKSDQGAMCHSYLDDGYGAQFRDYSSYIGWALFERYVVNELIGGRLSIAYGGLTHHAFTKTAMTVALEKIKPAGTYNAYYCGNTTAYTAAIERNYGVLGVDMLYMMIAQLRTQSGSPPYPVPVMEAVRVPSWQEIVDAHTIAHRIADEARRVIDLVDWERVDTLADKLIEGGREFCARMLEGFESLGVDIKDPLQLMLAARRLGPVELENRFGVGMVDAKVVGGFAGAFPTDTLSDFIEQRQKVFAALDARPKAILSPEHCVVVGSTDVHEYGMLLVVEALRAAGVKLVIAGTSVDPDEFADLALEVDATGLVVSTHNGMALTYAEHLLQQLDDRALKLPVYMGGTLNQDFEGVDTPVDVRDRLTDMGIRVCETAADIVGELEQVPA